jgi:threonine dehydrogenase-like Zn-dependent dehydrogenase
MTAIRLEEPGRFAQVDLEPASAALQPDEALVRVHRIGVCGTDIHAFKGDRPVFTYPRILGHELGVEVLELGGQADTIRAGQRCAVEPYLNCGTCIACRRSKPNCCVKLSVLGVHTDGGMSETSQIESRRIDTSPWITHRAPLSDVVTEFALWTRLRPG